MAETASPERHAAAALEHFRRRNSPPGLFIRYCRGRLRQARARLAVGLSGAAAFAVLHDPVHGFLAAILLLVGEAAESQVLRGIVKRPLQTEAVLDRAHRTARLAGAGQASTTILAVAIVWVLGDDGETEFLAAVFLAAAAMDAGFSIRAGRRIAQAKLALYMAAFVLFQAIAFWKHPLAISLSGNHVFDLVASLMLAFMTYKYIAFTARTHDQRLADERRILEEHERLTAARQALEAKDAEARQLALVARYANDGVVIYTHTGVVDWVNETFCRITGVRADQIIGHRIEDLLPSDDTDPEGTTALMAARREMRPYRGELMTRDSAGKLLWIEANLTPIPAAKGMPAMMIAVERDITGAKAHEAELAEARARAEEAAQAKARFLATMSHEIRTPMNGVFGTAELLAETPLDSDQKLYVDTIVESGKALLTIINDILDLSRLQAGAVVFARERVELSACVAGALELLRPAARAKGILVELSLPAGGGPLVMGDGGRLRQIVLNLVGNAIKFTEKGSVTVALSSHVVGRASSARVKFEIEVADTGIGIPADRVAAIFESFTQAGDEVGRKFGGTGLGLTISRHLAQEMGGELDVASKPGKGSVFSLRVALDRAPEDAATQAPTVPLPRAAAALASADRLMPVILLAEDNRTNAMIVERMLRPEGFDIVVTGDGSTALAAYREAPPDIVLMDLSMPGMSGFEALRAMREVERSRAALRRPIIALTANSFEEDRRACFAAGFDGFVTKPVQKAALITEILRAVAAVAAEASAASVASAITDMDSPLGVAAGALRGKPRRRTH